MPSSRNMVFVRASETRFDGVCRFMGGDQTYCVAATCERAVRGGVGGTCESPFLGLRRQQPSAPPLEKKCLTGKHAIRTPESRRTTR
jgi:hypothetical protein